MKKINIILLSAALLSTHIMGCAWNKKAQGGAIGAGAGGVVGGVIGHAAGNTALGAILGAAVGGTAGVLIGNKMDKQAAEMRKQVENAKIERVGEGIKTTFDAGILFATNSSTLQPPARTSIKSLVENLNKYPDTNIMIEGDTDNIGTDEYNQKLSERRAQAVADYAKSLGVAGSRISTVGLGESNPIGSNDTVEGRQQNRRVEIAIFANDKLKEAAVKGTLN